MLFARLLTHRLTIYYLGAILLLALGLSAAGQLSFTPLSLVFSVLLSCAACWMTDWGFARAFGVAGNPDSIFISALILCLIISPPVLTDYAAIGFFVLAAAWAMASKYLLVVGRRHLFNPAAFGAALMGSAFNKPVSWWVGDYALLLLVVVPGGLLILSRMRYYAMMASFALVVLGISALTGDPAKTLPLMALHSSFFFFAFVMLTEPRTAPVGPLRQVAYGALVGLLFAPTTHIGRYYFTPEAALLVGNLFAYLANRRRLGRFLPAWA
jgi:Na+-transporting NADH:ubiquinone oxidoreductase subunit NqrB